MIQAVRGGVGQLLGQNLGPEWYQALCDTPEEADALYSMHQAQSLLGGRLNGFGGNN